MLVVNCCWNHMLMVEVIYVVYVMCWNYYPLLESYVKALDVLHCGSICDWMTLWILNSNVIGV
jgi:hypothetical protein